MNILSSPPSADAHPPWCARQNCITWQTGDVDHRGPLSVVDARPVDDATVSAAVRRDDEGTPDGPLTGAVGVELRVVHEGLTADDGSPLVADVLLDPATAQAVALALLRATHDAVIALADSYGCTPAEAAQTWGVSW